MRFAVSCSHGSALRLWAKAPLTGLALLLAAAAAGPVSAENARTAKLEEIVQSRPAGVPMLAVVSLSRQRVTIYDADGWIMRAPVSSGRTGYETPAGIYSVLQKKVEHYSNLYDDASMPFMQRITWSGIALHAGPLPGYAASHGCVRMPPGFAEQLFGVTKLGLRVVVMRDDIAPADISHHLLFKPLVFKPGQPPEPEAAAANGPSPVVLEADQPAGPLQNLRALAADKAAQAQAAKAKADEARAAAAKQNKEAARATRVLRMALTVKTRADAQLWKAERQFETAGPPEAVQRAEEARALALMQQAEAQAAVEKVEAEVAPIQDLAARLREEAQAAENARLAAEEQARQAARKVLPISVFISRKTQRLYVRQAREPLFESPVAIAAADQPLGTYVFTALAYASEEEADLRWHAVSLYAGMPAPAPVPAQAPAKAQRRTGPDPDATGTDVAATKAALDRIAIPKEAMARISQIVSPGSSLIVSDEEVSRETGSGTDFIVVMSTEPQGGIAIRRRGDPDAFRYRFQRPFGGSPYGWGWGRPF